MEYYYQWPIPKDSPSMPEHKKWDDNFWGKSARCMRRRGPCLPPSNYFPRGHRPHLNHPTPFRSYDPSWKPIVPENSQPYCGRDFERTAKALPAHSFKKRPCHNRGNKRTSKPCDSERVYFHDAPFPGRYCGGPLVNDVYFNSFDYPHHGGHGMAYDPYLECSNGFGRFCESSAPMECIEDRVKSYPGNCSDILSTAVKVAIEDPLPEQVDFLVPSLDVGVELPKDEAEAAAQTLEQLFPSIRFSNTELVGECHEFLNATENSAVVQQVEPNKQSEQVAQLPTLLEEKPAEQQEKIAGSLEDAKPITDDSVAKDSVQFLANQNQFLSDVLSQFMSGRFDLNQTFLDRYQTADEIQNGNTSKPDMPPPSESSSGNIVEKVNTQEIRSFPTANESLQCMNERKYPHKPIELTNIESDMNCSSSSIDWDSFDYLFGKSMEETTQSSTLATQELSLAFSEPDFEAESLRCVNPNVILKDKRSRKRVKRVITNVEVKTKKIRQNSKRSCKEDEETVQSMCKTDVYTSTEESDVHEFVDAQTQVEESVVLKVDAGTQWYDSDVVGGGISQGLPVLEECDIDNMKLNGCRQEPFSMPTLENQNLVGNWNGDSSTLDSDVYETLFKSSVVSVDGSDKSGKVDKRFESVGTLGVATESTIADNQNCTERFSTSIERVTGFLSDGLNCVPIKTKEDNRDKIVSREREIQSCDSFDVAAYEVCPHVSSLTLQNAARTSMNTTPDTSKSKESSLKSLDPGQKPEVITQGEKDYLMQTECVEYDASEILYPVHEESKSSKVVFNQETLQCEMSKIQTSKDNETVEKLTLLGGKKLLELKNTLHEKSADENDGSLPECKVEILSLELPFHRNQDPQYSGKCKPGRPRKKRVPNQKSRKPIRPSKTPLPLDIVLPQVSSTVVQRRTMNPDPDQSPLKKPRLASLRCRS